jgi:hypothetical protein
MFRAAYHKEMATVAGGNRYIKCNKTTPVYGKQKQITAHFIVTSKQANRQTENTMFTTDSRVSYSSVDAVAKSQEGATVGLHPRGSTCSEGGVGLHNALRLIGCRIEDLSGGDGEHHQDEKDDLRTEARRVATRPGQYLLGH